FQPVVLDDHVLAFDVAGFVKAFTERTSIACRGLGRPAADKPDHRHRRLLRARRQRPRGSRAADKRDEIAPRHSITSLALASKVAGTVMPSILAICALMTNSNLVDCTTGKSTGFAPLRMRPLYTPTWR